MKLTHLLAGVAAAAMLGGAASAQYVQTTNFGTASTVSTNNTSTNPVTAGRYYIASEVNIASLNSATLTVGIAAAGATSTQWANPGAATFTINLQNAVFSSTVNSSALAGAAPAPGCLAADITVTGGGTVGSNTVSFSIADISNCGAGLNFTSANGVSLTGTNANVSTTLIRQLGNTPINTGASTTAGTTGAFIQSLPGISFRGVTPTPVTVIPLAALNTLVPVGSNFILNVRNGRNLVGATEVIVANSLTAAGGLTAATATASLGLASTAGFSVSGSTVGGVGFGATNSAAITVAVNAATGALGADLAIVLADSAPNAAKQTQNVTITPAVTYAAASGLTATTYSPVLVGRLSRAGQQTNPFTWVGDGVTTSAISVFRHTGVPATVPGIRFILSNATNGASFNGEYTIPAGALTRSAGGEIVSTSLNLSQIAGNFGRADVVWVFDLAPGTPINTQRFVQAPNGTLAPAPEENAARTNTVAAFN
jgi:hypothetical protein